MMNTEALMQGFLETVSSVSRSLKEASSGDDSSSSSSSSSEEGAPFYAGGITTFEKVLDVALGLAFLITTIFAANRVWGTRQQSGAETTVVTAFYSLILITSTLRSLWFLIPSTIWTPSYTPIAVFAWDSEHPSWVGAALSELVLTAGSLTLFSIFILILVYWADILKKYFDPAVRRPIPMVSFLALVTALVALELINIICFLLKLYSTEGMILFNSCLLALVSITCVAEITIFSYRFRTVLKTLGAINQVSTDSQVQRIVWITVTGNLFFFTRAFLETILCVWMILWWKDEHTVARVFTHAWWDTYVVIKFTSEVTILSLMLYILQSRFATRAAAAAASRPAGYVSVPNAEDPVKPEMASTGLNV